MRGSEGRVRLEAQPLSSDWVHEAEHPRMERLPPELFADTTTHKQVRLYDLRATGITWRCLRQDYGPEIQQAAGHEKYDTTDGQSTKSTTGPGAIFETP